MFSQFAEAVAVYRDRSTRNSRLDRAVLEEIGEMMAPVARGRVRQATITVDDVLLSVSSTTSAERFDLALSPETNLSGTVSGFVDVINVHREPLFYLYPSEGPRITCRFDRTYLDEARLALRQYCRVHGLLTFTDSSPYPLRVDVERIEVPPESSAQRTLRSFVGSVPDLTGGMEAVEYLQRLRDAED
ncbi:hypothetical protein [Gemmatimonas sp.]|uniref:hypothetical protein n=1 Tax=Gemmatimonas sp. TaxID=1962908 RepID=UPI0022CBDD00|nr:hypothetical protein [Gemmatimonas sp.]MCZ8203728.1 hypothetical protein [Gemmatimonas sp.]